MNPLIIANWKCNPSSAEKAQKLFSGIKKGLPKNLKAKAVICPPFVYLEGLSGRGLEIGAQDCFWQEGPFTGQIACSMVKKIGCRYVIIGHSEKREMGDSDRNINKKLKSCLEQKLTPVFCVGETLKQKKANQTARVLKKQIKGGLKGISKNGFEKIVIAYEPVWAISGKKSFSAECSPEIAKVCKLLIKKYIKELYGKEAAEKARVLYGGSVNSQNALPYVKEAGVDGFIVGGKSLKAKEFIAILKNFC